MKTLSAVSILLLSFLLLKPEFINGYFLSGQAENFQVPAHSSVVSPNTNIRIFPGSFLQVETSAATSPLDSARIVGAAITNYIPGGYTIGYYASANNGLSWSGTDHISNALGVTITTVGDPIINISNNGNHIITYIAFSPTGGNELKLGVSYSANSGAYWSPTVYIPGVDSADKPISTTDNISTSPYLGRTYVAYGELNFDQSRNKGIFFSFSSNGGVTWDISKRITNVNSFQNRLVGDIALGPSGDVYVLWFTNPSFLGLAKSTNGGSNWIINNDVAINTNRGSLSENYNDFYLQGVPVLEVDHSVGTRNGWLYAVNVQTSSDSMDIVLHRSTNSGNTWAHIKVNQDPTGPVRIQGMPTLNVDKYGGINIFYYDTRNSIANDSFGIYMSRSVDGGNNFEDIKVSDHNFKLGSPPVSLFGVFGYIGSYIGVTDGVDKIIPVWFDNSTGQYQAWTSSIELLPVYEIKVIPEGFYDIVTKHLRMKDTLKVFLRNSTFPYAIVDSAAGIIDSVSFTASLKFHPYLNSGNYYLVVKHRNSIETWSSTPLPYKFGSKVIYDFTSSSGSAFGNNLKPLDGKWAVYSGDVNQDGIVNLTDVLSAYNASINFLTGYVAEDCDGNSLVNLSDLLILYNNAQSFVRLIRP